MSPVKALRDRLDLSAYPGVEIIERGRQHLILRYHDLDVDIECRPLTEGLGKVCVDSFPTEPCIVRRPGPPTTWKVSNGTAQDAQRLVDEHLARVGPMNMLLDALPDDERPVTLPLVLRLPAATRDHLGKLADEVGVELEELVSDLIQRQHLDGEET